MRKCSNCQYSSGGSPDSLSDFCDGCRTETPVGWGGGEEETELRYRRAAQGLDLDGSEDDLLDD